MTHLESLTGNVQQTAIHVPILVQPIVKALLDPFIRLSELSKDSKGPSPSHWLVDCTLGGGGHTAAFLEAFGQHPQLSHHKILSIDRDFDAVQRAKIRFRSEIGQGRLEIIHRRFGEAADLVESRPVLGLMADLGFSSDQLEDSQRGLSFQGQGPLDMRLDPTQGRTCRDLLAQSTEKELETLLSELGEERFARRIASAIIRRREMGQLPSTTQELVDTVVRAVPSFARHGRIHVATRTFQALRIAVNEELSELDGLLERVILRVKPTGRIAILSFHSLEDRKVKQQFKKSGFFLPLSKKPIQADEAETQRNLRSRSAKLRIAERSDQC